MENESTFLDAVFTKFFCDFERNGMIHYITKEMHRNAQTNYQRMQQAWHVFLEETHFLPEKIAKKVD